METMPPTTIHIVGLELNDAAGILHIAGNSRVSEAFAIVWCPAQNQGWSVDLTGAMTLGGIPHSDE